jgi:hypothetical protein
MHILLRTLGRQHGVHFQDEKAYAKFLYRLFPNDPVHTLGKLAGLPKPLPDTRWLLWRFSRLLKIIVRHTGESRCP